MKKVNRELINKIFYCIHQNFLSDEERLSVRKISNLIDIPYQTVWYYIKQMTTAEEVVQDKKYGYILKEDLNKSSNKIYKNIPVLGNISCGDLNISELFTDEYIKLPNNIVNGNDYFILKAKGDSMIKIGIESEDYVLIQKQEFAYPGQVVVMLSNEFSDSGITLKRYYPEPNKNRIRLHPENDLMEDFYIHTGTVQGIAKKVIKIKDIT